MPKKSSGTDIKTIRPIVSNGKTKLADIDTSSTCSFVGDKSTTAAILDEMSARLTTLQTVLYAEQKHKILIVLQAMDTGGKDGVIRKVFSGINPQGVRIASFKAPTPPELAHDYLWRVHQQVEEGTTILKFFLHISKDEQKQRLQDRLDDPAKTWKFNIGDLAEREKWDDYQRMYEDAINETSSPHAPWHIVPADRKWIRDLYVSSVLVTALEDLNMAYPKPAEGLDKVKIV
jgi:polyphosphate kinase 2 (PPK2 family)